MLGMTRRYQTGAGAFHLPTEVSTTMNEERREVTLREASQLSGLSDKTLRRMIADQRVRFSQDSRGRYRIALDDLPAREVDPLADLRTRLEAVERRLARLERAERPAPSFTYVPPVMRAESPLSVSGGDSGDDPPGTMRAGEWADRIGADATTVRRYIKDGIIPGIKRPDPLYAKRDEYLLTPEQQVEAERIMRGRGVLRGRA